MKNKYLSFSLAATLSLLAALTCSAQDANNPFLEAGGYLAFEAESMPYDSNYWNLETSISGYSGTGYLVGKQDNFNNGGRGAIRYPIKVTTSGRYQLQWKTRITEGDSNTDFNDSFARITDANGILLDTVANDNNREADPNWYKVYMNRVGRWSYDAKNKDNDPHSLSWQLQADTLYYFEISNRSKGHGIDRVVLWDTGRFTRGDTTTGSTNHDAFFDTIVPGQVPTDDGQGGTGTGGNTDDGANNETGNPDNIIDIGPPRADDSFLEENGLVVIEAESVPWDHTHWTLETSLSGYLGNGYLVATTDSFNQGGLGAISYPIEIANSGRYQLQWKSRITEGDSTTDFNDNFARITDASGDLLEPVPNDNNRDSDPQWYKVYMNKIGEWIYDAKNKDNDPHGLSWQLEAGKKYFVEISNRSRGHAIDRIVLWAHNGFGHDFGDKTTGREKNAALLNNTPQTPRENDPEPAVYNLRPGATGGFDPAGSNFYLDTHPDLLAVTSGSSVLGINPDSTPDLLDFATISQTFHGESGNYDILLPTVGENDGSPTFTLKVDGATIGSYSPPLSTETFEVGPPFNGRFQNVVIENGDSITVQATIAMLDGEFARARWMGIQLLPPGSLFPTPGSGDGSVAISGEKKQWHKTTLTLDGPLATEDGELNPFLQYRMDVAFTHTESDATYTVPAYFAADGNAAETSAASGTKWRAHLAPDQIGEWTYQISFKTGDSAAVDPSNTYELAPYHGLSGSFTIAATDKSLPDNRSRGRLEYVGERYLKFAGNSQYFIKAGADSPETFLAYSEFDGTSGDGLKTYTPHLADWQDGDPTWQSNKGKGIIGALNYLAGKGGNAFSFIPYNTGGDGDNVWPHASKHNKEAFDVSKLDQWGIVFDHAETLGMFIHFKTQETENDDKRGATKPGGYDAALDGGAMGKERALYYRELIARYSHLLALNWNLGEESTQSASEVKAMAQYFYENDPYNKSETARRHIVIHSYPTPSRQDTVYDPLLGTDNFMSGVSLQNPADTTHERVKKWLAESESAGRQWAVANDEQGSPSEGVPPDIGYEGYTGEGRSNTQDNLRDNVLYGTLFAGGWGIESYFGYQLPQTDLNLEDFRSRDQWWEFCAHAIGFFNHHIPFHQMEEAANLTSGKYALSKAGEVYAIYTTDGAETTLDLTSAPGTFKVSWYNPRTGGELQTGSQSTQISGGSNVSIGSSPEPGSDWIALVEIDIDEDNDGLSDSFESNYGSDSTSLEPNADDDQDGLTALMEFALGTNPNQFTSSPSIRLISQDGQEYISYQFTQSRESNSLLNLWVESSEDLKTWIQINTEEQAGSNQTHKHLLAKLPYQAASPKRFIRLRATAP